jgi:DNA-binding NarL/FixJ family response regulator
MIRVAIADDHPAIAAGLTAVLRAEPGFAAAGAVDGEAGLAELLARERPDVLLLDYHLPGTDGLRLCRRVAARADAPRVVLYSAYADGQLALAARAAGADGIASKGAPADELFDLLRRVHRGERVLPPVEREQLADAAERLEAEDVPLLSLLLDGTAPADVCALLRLSERELEWRSERLLARLRVEVPAAARP